MDTRHTSRTPGTTAALVALLLASCGDASTNDAGVEDAAHDAMDATADADASDGGDAGDDPDAATDAVGDPDDGDVAPTEPLWALRALPQEPGPRSPRTLALLARVGTLSPWENRFEGAVMPEVGARGALGVGNGRVFGFVGYDETVTTLHSLIGPSYELRDGFFGDYTLRLFAGGEPVPVTQQRSGRLLGAPVAYTSGFHGTVRVETIDLAPPLDSPLGACIARVVVLENTSAERVEATLVVRSVRGADATGPTLTETRADRSVDTRVLGGAASASPGRIEAPVQLGGGEQIERVVLHCTRRSDDAPSSAETDAEALLDLAVGLRMAAPPARYTLPEPATASFVDGMRQTLRVQRSEQGAWCPMSQYTRMWVRDTIGPLLAMLAFGDTDAAGEMLDYLWRGAVRAGDFRNSYDADLPVGEPVTEPDWDALPPLAGRTAAETPSYLVWMYAEHWLATGDTERIAARWPMLRRAMFAQAMSPERLLPFSGDETFRAAMNGAFGLALEYPHHEDSWSLNSALLWLGAARRFVWMAEAIGQEADAAAARATSALVQASIDERYRLTDGCLGALIDRATDRVWDAPFEDAALQVAWAGAWEPRGEAALEAFGCLVERLERAPGMLISPAHPMYHALPMLGGADGAYTGMLPGYALYSYAAHGHADALHAAAWMGRAADPTGNFQEYLVGGTHTGLQLQYDAQGNVGDYTAKFRPWEGGINVHALLYWLFGLERHPDGIAIAPALPPGWPAMDVQDWPALGSLWSVQVARGTGTTEVRIRHTGAEARSATIRMHDVTGGTLIVGDGAEQALTSSEGPWGRPTIETTVAIPPDVWVHLVLQRVGSAAEE